MKRILRPVLAVAVLAAVGIYAVAYVKEQIPVEEWIRETLQVTGGEVPLDEAVVDWARPERPLDQFFADHGYVC